MPKIKVEKPFPFSPDGKSVVDIEVGEQEVSERLATVAVEHLKVAKLVKEGATKKPSKQESTAPDAGEAGATQAEANNS